VKFNSWRDVFSLNCDKSLLLCDGYWPQVSRCGQPYCTKCFWMCRVRIDARRKELRARRDKALQKCLEREKQLEASQGLQEFKRDADEVAVLY